MSVVNKMLNDLENREQNQAMSADYQPPEKHKYPLLGILALLVLVAGGAWTYFQYAPQWLAKNKNEQTLSKAPENQTISVQKGATDNSLAGSSADNVSSIAPSALADIAKIAQQETRRIREGNTAAKTESVDSINNADDGESQNTDTDGQTLTTISTSETNVSEDVPSGGEATKIAEETSHSLSISDVTQLSPQTNEVNLESEPTEKSKENPSAMAVTLSDNTDVDMGRLKLSAQKALADKDTEKAIVLLGRILNEQPDNVNARKQLASLLFANREPGKAETLLHYGLQLNPQQHDIRLMLARLYQQNERHDDALTLLQKVSPDVTLNIDYYNQRASLAQRLSQFEQASQDYQVLVNVEPEQAKWWLGLGVSSDKLNESSAAILGYTRALSLNQLDAPVTAFMQQRLRGLGR